MVAGELRAAARQGAYDAARAAALSGVPTRTLYDWKDRGIVVPSVRSSRVMLWSYEDLLTLRLVRWLREDKPDAIASSMRQVREALDAFGDDLWSEEDASTLVVGSDGTVVHRERGVTPSGQAVVDGMLDLFASYEGAVDLRQPRPRLRIVPGRCAGEIHLQGSRLTSLTVHALARRGYSDDHIATLYPHESVEALAEACDLEHTLELAA